MKERLDFLNLVNKKIISEKDLNTHARKYPALFFNTYTKSEVINFLKNRKQEKSDKNLAKEQTKLETNLKEIKKIHSIIYSKIKNKKLKEYAETLQGCAIDRYRLKHIWSGGEYLCLNLLQETSKRIGIDFENFIKCYLFQDIYNFLKNNKRLNEKEIKDRKKCLLIHYTNKKIRYYLGQEAINYKHRSLHNEKIRQSGIASVIKGSIANKGLVRGLARVVNVKDLSQYIKDSKNFQRGEILVTTMTSPIMVPIIEKAGGIITDEGGITSHAAVISREFKIPCIVGTHGASSIIKTGELVELDANSGEVKKIQNS